MVDGYSVRLNLKDLMVISTQTSWQLLALTPIVNFWPTLFFWSFSRSAKIKAKLVLLVTNLCYL